MSIAPLDGSGDNAKSAQEPANWDEDDVVKRGSYHCPSNDAKVVQEEDGPLAANDVGKIATQDRSEHLPNVGDAHHCWFLRGGHISILRGKLGKEDGAEKG